jgi:hypothetical protein
MAVETQPGWHRWLPIAVWGGLLVLWSLRITDQPIEKDAAENLTMSIDLYRHGILSEDTAPPYRVSLEREPLPAFETAALIAVSEVILGRPATDDAYFEGARARLLKSQNVLWMGVLLAVFFIAIRQLTSSSPAAWVGVALLHLSLMGQENTLYLVDSLYTEAQATALLTLGSFLLARGMFRKHWLMVAAAGVLFGLLALVKAIFLYVFIGLIVATAGAVLLGWMPAPKKGGLGKVLILGLCFSVVVIPCMLTNYRMSGTFAITSHGGEVLYVRAIKDRMSAVEARGALFYWAPWPVNGVLRRAFGFDRGAEEAGGPLQRLNRSGDSSFAASDMEAERTGRPDLAVSYYRQARAEESRLELLFQREGFADFEIRAERAVQKKALQMIGEQPVRHLLMTPLFLWRGAFYPFPILVLALLLSVRKRQFEQALFVIPALGMVLLYGLVSHYIPRYSLPMTPITTVGFIVVCMYVLRHLRTSRPLAR